MVDQNNTTLTSLAVSLKQEQELEQSIMNSGDAKSNSHRKNSKTEKHQFANQMIKS